ncbi:ankyrin repeat-containing domain protein [Hyaloscypha sp. PMI_1271]|nr:ankyrin repeat-containing domain protein [Hyaloscypha sp. PMI_1271]
MYDSGALCASVRLAGTQSKFGPMRELLARRDTAKPDEIDPVLENTAIVLAARYKMLDAFEQLLQHPQPREDCATSDCSDWDFTDPFRYYYELGLGPVDFFHNPNSKSQCDDPSPSDWAGWHHPGRRIYPPLFVIVSFRDEQLFQAMLNRGYQPDGKTLLAAAALGYSHSMLKAIIGTAIDLGYRQTDLSPTVLQWAVYYRKSSLCQLLLDHGANINAPHFYDIRCSGEDRARTALQAAIEESETANTSTLVALALRAGAFVDAPAHYQRGATALQIAAIQGKIALARDLIRLKADVNAARGLVGGRTCLEGAAEHGRLDMVKFLLESGVQTTQEHRVQYIRAIRFAIEREHQRVADFLRSHREWDSTDDTVFKESHLTTDRVFRRIGRYRRRSREAEWCAFIHPLEHPLPERLKLRCWCRKTHIALPLDPEAEEYETNQNTDMVSVNHRYTAKIFQDQPDLQHGALPAGTLASILQVNEEQDWMEADSVNEEADLQSLFYNRQDCQDYSNLQLDTEMQGCEKWWGNRMLLDSRINQSVDFREIIEIDE